jgi:hypothetical protein
MQIKPHSNSSLTSREGTPPAVSVPPSGRAAAPRYIMPSSRGSHSDISGM